MTPLKGGLIGSGITAVLITSLFLGLHFLGCGKSELVVNVKVPQINKIIKTATTCPEWKACSDSQINISHEVMGDFLMIKAMDDCKSAEISYEIKRAALMRKLSIQAMPFLLAGYNSSIKKPDFMGGAQLAILRNYNLVSIGGAGIYAKSFITKDWYAGAGAVLGFNP